jgi:putative membrane protein
MRAEKYFTPEERKKIEQAVIAAEQRTSGEVVPMIVAASSRYAEIDLACVMAGLLLGILAAIVWGDPWGLAHAQLAWPAGGAALGLLLCRIPPIKRRLIPQSRMDQAVDRRSLTAFTAQGLHHTTGETGILILASLFEHRVEVLADRGINAKVPPGTWGHIVRLITTGLKENDSCAAFCAAIEECGKMLAEHFPRSPDDRDELKNKPVTEE